METKKYSSVSIPRSVFVKLTRLVGHHGFRSTAEVVMACIRDSEMKIDMWLDQIEKEDILHEIRD